MSATKTKKTASAKNAKTPKGKPANAKRTKPVKTAKPKDGKLSALDAAAKVLASADEPMTCKELIETMAEKKLWTSPNGKTPDRTLNAALQRDIHLKGKESRFVKAERGQFAANK